MCGAHIVQSAAGVDGLDYMSCNTCFGVQVIWTSEDREKTPPLMVQKSDGGFGYARYACCSLFARSAHFVVCRVCCVVGGCCTPRFACIHILLRCHAALPLCR